MEEINSEYRCYLRTRFVVRVVGHSTQNSFKLIAIFQELSPADQDYYSFFSIFVLKLLLQIIKAASTSYRFLMDPF